MMKKKKNSICIRKLKENETDSALELARKVFVRFESPVYPKEGTDEFCKSLHDSEYQKGIVYYGAFDKESLVGMLGVRKDKGHICYVFVDGEYQHRGTGKKLVETMLNDFPDRTVTLNSSPYGIRFYESLGFTPVDCEQMVNGIRFTPMIKRGANSELRIVKLSQRHDLKEKAAVWFSEKWSVPLDAYLESIENSFSSVIPSWYVCLDDETIIAGMGVIENDFHNRTDLTPNVCAVYTEPEYRNRGIAGLLLNFVCNDMAGYGIDTLYLLTDHTGFYERYGWDYYCMAYGDGEDEPSRMYIHNQKPYEAEGIVPSGT